MYLKQFSPYIEQFMDRAKLWPYSKRALVGVSGGIDSMALLLVLHNLLEKKRLNSLKVVHIDHGTQENAMATSKMISDYCQKLGLEFTTKSFQLSLNLGNFEALARSLRYEVFKGELKKGDLFYTAHHLDDSFEWSLMQQFKSSSYIPTLGIPVIRDFVARPFLCVSKKHIQKFVESESIPFKFDHSNDDLKFERNFLRKKITSEIEARFPSYLKHYAYRANDQAIKLGKSRLAQKREWRIHRDQLGGVALLHPGLERNFEGADEEIIRIISSLSGRGRGVLRSQVSKMIEAARAGKVGPLTFSGGVQGYMGAGVLYFVNEGISEKFINLDEKLLTQLQNKRWAAKDYLNFEELRILSLKTNCVYPHFVFSRLGNQPGLPGSLRSPHMLLPKSTGFALEENLWFNSVFKTLSHWKKTGAQGQVRLFIP